MPKTPKCILSAEPLPWTPGSQSQLPTPVDTTNVTCPTLDSRSSSKSLHCHFSPSRQRATPFFQGLRPKPSMCLFFFFLIYFLLILFKICFFNFSNTFFFPTVQHGDPATHTCIFLSHCRGGSAHYSLVNLSFHHVPSLLSVKLLANLCSMISSIIPILIPGLWHRCKTLATSGTVF